MKKVVSILLAVLMASLMLAGCGNTGNTKATSVDSLKTLGDALALDSETEQSATYEDAYVYVFEWDGIYYRAIANLSSETSAALWDLDVLDDNYEEQRNDLISPLAIDKLENLNDQILSQDALDALVGKTGQELLDEGWSSGYGYNLESMEFWMDYGAFNYTVVFDGEVAEEDYETFDEEEGIKDMTVKLVEFNALGDATNIEE